MILNSFVLAKFLHGIMLENGENSEIVLSKFLLVSDGKLQPLGDVIRKPIIRKKLSPQIRQFIWSTTNGRCYLCKKELPLASLWHVEHILAFSEDPLKNDMLGNMLPSCVSCNCRKKNNTLLDCIMKDATFDLATESKNAAHLNSEARNAIVVALQAKYDRRNFVKHSDSQEIDTVVSEMENVVKNNCQRASLCTISTLLPSFESYQLQTQNVHFDIDNNDNIRFGSFGQIHVGKMHSQETNSLIDVAVKLPSYLRGEVAETLTQEIKILTRVKHKYIVQFYGWFETASSRSDVDSITSTSKFGLVLEWCSHSLNMDVAAMNVDPFRTFLGISSALSYMHSLSIYHRDVKPANILVHKRKDDRWLDAVAKLCDFGSAKFITADPSTDHTSNSGTAAFRAPEVRNGCFVPESDVYALGKTMSAISHLNRCIQGDAGVAAFWNSLVTDMCIDYYVTRRPPLPIVYNRLLDNCPIRSIDKIAADFPRVALDRIASVPRMASALVSEDPQAVSLSNKERSIAEPKQASSKATDRKLATSPKRNINQKAISVKSPTTMIALTPDATVFITCKGKSRRNPAGARQNKYHLTKSCGYLAGRATVQISVEEAEECSHQPCKGCCAVRSEVSSPVESNSDGEKETKVLSQDSLNAHPDNSNDLQTSLKIETMEDRSSKENSKRKSRRFCCPSGFCIII